MWKCQVPVGVSNKEKVLVGALSEIVKLLIFRRFVSSCSKENNELVAVAGNSIVCNNTTARGAAPPHAPHHLQQHNPFSVYY